MSVSVVSEEQTASDDPMRPEERRSVQGLAKLLETLEEVGGQFGGRIISARSSAAATESSELRGNVDEVFQSLEAFGGASVELLDGFDAEAQTLRRRDGIPIIHISQFRHGTFAPLLITRRRGVDPDHLLVEVGSKAFLVVVIIVLVLFVVMIIVFLIVVVVVAKASSALLIRDVSSSSHFDVHYGGRIEINQQILFGCEGLN